MDSACENWSHFLLCIVFQEFVKCTNKDIEQIIKKEMSGDVKNTFYAIGNNGLWPSVFSVSALAPFNLWLNPFSHSLLFSSQCKEPALLFCRPLVQSHEGIFSQCIKYVYPAVSLELQDCSLSTVSSIPHKDWTHLALVLFVCRFGPLST